MGQMAETIHAVVWGPWTMMIFLAAGIWFTVKSGGFQFFGFSRWWKETVGSIWEEPAAGRQRKGRGRKPWHYAVSGGLYRSGSNHRDRQYCGGSHSADSRWAGSAVLDVGVCFYGNDDCLCRNLSGAEVPLPETGRTLDVRTYGIYGAGRGEQMHGCFLCRSCSSLVSGNGKYGAVQFHEHDSEFQCRNPARDKCCDDNGAYGAGDSGGN